MKKTLAICLCLSFLAITSVSFASNRAPTTKVCVIDNLDVMETPEVVYEVSLTDNTLSDVNSLESVSIRFSKSFKEADNSFDEELKKFSDRNLDLCIKVRDGTISEEQAKFILDIRRNALKTVIITFMANSDTYNSAGKTNKIRELSDK